MNVEAACRKRARSPAGNMINVLGDFHVLQVLLAVPLLWLLVSVVCCWDSTMPKPVLAADGSVCSSNGVRQKAA